MSRRRLLIVLLAFVGALAAISIAALVWLGLELRGSLPVLSGSAELPGLSAPVRIERDGLGIPTITAVTRVDVARATGWVHAQDRFFQMDLSRRQAAGELSALVGGAALPLDRRHRLHRFRARARKALELLDDTERALLEAYAAGVNAGLAALDARPFEYLLLGAEPTPWLPEDSLLVVYAMFLTLQDDEGWLDLRRGVLHDTLPPALYAFLTPDGGEWDAPLVGGALPTPRVPAPSEVDLGARHRPAGLPSGRVHRPARVPAAAGLPIPGLAWLMPFLREAGIGEAQGFDGVRGRLRGSNNWAVAGGLTADGGALVANDMHLPLSVPNIWYRVALGWTEDRRQRGAHQVIGLSLPGTPAVIAGSNRRVAWGFTNAEGDWTDVVLVERVNGGKGYRTPDGVRTLERVTETIEVRDERARDLTIEETRWGPIGGVDHRGRPYAVDWVAHHPGAVDLGLLRLEVAATLEEAMLVAQSSGLPAQNIVIADRSGRIGWTIAGRVPGRVAHDGTLPRSGADEPAGLDGWIAAGTYPAVTDPELGRVWSANNRVGEGPAFDLLGLGSYDVGARARQIRDDLLALERATPRDMLAVQLDDRALFLERWRDLAREVLSDEAVEGSSGRAAFRRLVDETWSGRASIDSVGYRLVRQFRLRTAEMVFAPLMAPAVAADPGFRVMRWRRYEGPLWSLVTARPAHLLDPAYDSWAALLIEAIDRTVDGLGGPGQLDARTWGDANTLRMRHPMSQVLGFLAPWLDMAAEPLPGDSNMPRVQDRDEGASERMVVSPGREEAGILHMPGGQSGHPLSAHYRDGHRAWVEGRPTPFLPGPTTDVLTLTPPAGPRTTSPERR